MVVSLFLPFVEVAQAADTLCYGAAYSALCNITLSQSGTLVRNIVTILLIIAIIVAVIFLIIGGIRWIISGGDKGKIQEARTVIISAIVGLILAFLTYFIVNAVTFFITGQTFMDINIPRLVP